MLRSIAAAVIALSCEASPAAMTTNLSFSDLMQSMRSFQESRLLLTAVELDVFTAVGAGAPAPVAAERMGTNARATETLLNALVAVGALTKRDGIFRNTPDTARYLVEGSPYDARPALMHTVNMWRSWSSLTDSVQIGTAAEPPALERNDSRRIESFIAAMHRNAEMTAREVVQAVGAGEVRRMLDVGGGSGAYSIAFAKANPKLSADVLDLASVVPIAQKHIAAAGLADRIATRTGDLTTDDLGRNYDLVLLSAICHMLGPQENLDLFRRSWGALASGGRLVIRDFVLDPDKTSPKAAALFAVHMLVNTRGGSTYSEDEYRSWLAEAGFRNVVRHETARDMIIATR